MYSNGFIEDLNILQENSKVGDLLDLTEYADNYLQKIEGYEDSSLIALKGRFGIGKSTFLYQLEQKFEENTNVKWFEFDAWKYPDRANLWESFVLELAKVIDEDNFNKTIRKIDGKTPTPWVEKLVNFSAGLVGSIKNFNDFLNTSPAKRTFEVQNILIDLINSLEEDILYIVIEDIDRSGDSGIYFLETLNHFLKNADISKSIKAVVPISEDSYIEEKSSYHKCFDYINDFQNPEYKLDRFCKNIFIDEITGRISIVDSETGEETVIYNQIRSYKIILEFLEGLFMYHNNNFTLRELKLVLRNSNEKYKSLSRLEGEGINFMLCIAIEASKLVIGNNEGDCLYDIWKKSNKINGSQLFTALFKQVNDNTGSDSIYEDHAQKNLNSTLPHNLLIKNFKLSEQGEKKGIYFYNGSHGFKSESSYLYIGDFYLKD